MHRFWESTKWIATGLFVTGTIMMLSPIIAAQSIWPWILYLLGNGIWAIDSYHTKNYPWLGLSIFFCVWDVLLIYTRVFKIEVLEYQQYIFSFVGNNL